MQLSGIEPGILNLEEPNFYMRHALDEAGRDKAAAS